MTVYPDLGAWALAHLRADPAVAAQVVGGTAQILEAGELTAAALDDAQEARRESGSSNQVLAIVVQDLGERELVTSCAVIIYDRYGYQNVRAAREAVITALVNHPASLARDAFINQVHYAGRSGHAIDAKLDLDFESVTFSGELITESDSYY